MKLRMLSIFIFLSITSLTIYGCVSTNIASFKDPDYDSQSFGRYLVIGNYEKFEMVKMVEGKVVAELTSNGVYAVANSKILPPIREYTDDERRNAFIKYKLDAYLIVSPAGVNNATLYVPSISTTNESASASGNRAHSSSSTVTTPGGEREVLSSVDTKAELYDFQNNHIVWKGQANTNIQYNAYGQTFATADNILDSFCSHIVDELAKNDLLKKNH
jgi:hypothetical protein